MYKKSEIPGNGLKNFQNVFKMLTMLVLLLVGSQTVLILHIVALLAKNDFSPDITS